MNRNSQDAGLNDGRHRAAQIIDLEAERHARQPPQAPTPAPWPPAPPQTALLEVYSAIVGVLARTLNEPALEYVWAELIAVSIDDANPDGVRLAARYAASLLPRMGQSPA